MEDVIRVKGAREHNLKNIDLDIPRGKLVVITGLSGSGKSSLAFDTIYAEGQRRYVESLSAYAKQFLHLQNKPDVESITGLSPAIAIEQKTTSRNPRSTVGTVTEIYDYLRLLYARVGVPYSPVTGLPIKSQTVSEMVDIVKDLPINTKIHLLAPIARGDKGEFKKELAAIQKQGFQKIVINGQIYDDFTSLPELNKNKKHNIDVLIDRLIINEELGNRLADSIELALKIGDGLAYVDIIELGDKEEAKNSQDNSKKEIDNIEDLNNFSISLIENENLEHNFVSDNEEMLLIQESEEKNNQKNERIIFSARYSCPVSGFQLSELEPRIFSFNSPFGACSACNGLGKEMFFDPDKIIPDQSLSLKDGAIKPWKNYNLKVFFDIIDILAKFYQVDINASYASLPEDFKKILLWGSGDQQINFEYNGSKKIAKPFVGIIKTLEERYNLNLDPATKDELSKYKSEYLCKICQGHRLKKESLSVKIEGMHIGQIVDMDVNMIYNWAVNLESKLSPKDKLIANQILKEIKARLFFLIEVGLEYLTMNRETSTLSGGENQRVRLASQIGSGLKSILYVLDEPSIGLHPRDNEKLISILHKLRDLGNTVLVVEHDEEIMQKADYIIDIGPGAGIHGGKVIAVGTLEDIKRISESITGQYLKKEKYIPIPESSRSGHKEKNIILKGISVNNLHNVDVTFRLGTFTVITGVSGSGKSTLVHKALYKACTNFLNKENKIDYIESVRGIEHIDSLINIDQSPIGRTPRSNPATYIGFFTFIRELFAGLPEAKARGYKAGRFSFNVKGGRCEICQGGGLIKIEMHFLPDIYVNCDACNGKRYNRETLEVLYKGKSITDVLEMTAEDARDLFDRIPQIADKLTSLIEVGLAYIKIGQSATTLSGGEAQRIKLAKELSKRSTGKTLYILDEPTTGLHIDDISKLLKVLHKFVDNGNTVVVIEHNLEVIKTADYIIDIGPEGGRRGGKIVCSGTPKEIIACPESYTGKYLKNIYNI